MDYSRHTKVPSFARGLPILVVDDDTTSLMHFASILEQFSFRVTTIELASIALSMIRQQPERFKLVIAKVNMKEIHILSFVRSVMKWRIPVILCSSSEEENMNLAKKALVEGASHVLENPISMEDLRYIWQIALRRKVNKIEEVIEESKESGEEGRLLNNPARKNRNMKAGECSYAGREKSKQIEEGMNKEINNEVDENGKRIRVDSNEERNPNNNDNDNERADQNERPNENEEGEGHGQHERFNESIEEREKQANGKRPQFVWTLDIHKKFTAAVSALGDKKSRSKTILKNMEVPNLTARPVGSHLQKYDQQIKPLHELEKSSAPSNKVPANTIVETQVLQAHGRNRSFCSQPTNGNRNYQSGAPSGLPSTSYARGHNGTKACRGYGAVNHSAGFSSFPGSSIQRQQTHNFVDLTQDQFGRFEGSTNANQVNEMRNFPSNFNWHDNGRENRPLLPESSSAHMSGLNLPSGVGSQIEVGDRFQFPNVINDANQGLNSEMGGLAQTVNDNGIDKQIPEFPSGNVYAPRRNLPNNTGECDSSSMDFTDLFGDIRQEDDVRGLSTQTCSLLQSHEQPKNDKVLITLEEEERKKNEEALAGHLNDLEFDKIISEFTNENQKTDNFPALPTPNCPLTQSQSHPTNGNRLARTERHDENPNEGAVAGDQFHNVGMELAENDVDQCFQWLSENLFDD